MSAPDSRYYVHASTQAAHAQQDYLVEEGAPRLPSRAHAKARMFDLRTDWWIVLTIIALGAFMALLVMFVR